MSTLALDVSAWVETSLALVEAAVLDVRAVAVFEAEASADEGAAPSGDSEPAVLPVLDASLPELSAAVFDVVPPAPCAVCSPWFAASSLLASALDEAGSWPVASVESAEVALVLPLEDVLL